MRLLGIWVLGFFVLFLFNAFVEAILLPRWGLDDTPRNDIYFQCWWAVVGLWFLFGIPALLVITSSSRPDPSGRD